MSLISALIKTATVVGCEMLRDNEREKGFAETQQTLVVLGRQGTRMVFLLCVKDLMRFFGFGVLLGAVGLLSATGFEVETLFKMSLGIVIGCAAFYAILFSGIIFVTKK